MNRVAKLLRVMKDPRYWRGLAMGVAASVEHQGFLPDGPMATVVDIGANRGQFALLASRTYPGASIFSFEPLPEPAGRFRRLFAGQSRIRLQVTAIGPNEGRAEIQVAHEDDSSSILPPTGLQEEIFPGTGTKEIAEVRIAPLDTFLDASDIIRPALLKLDVQGFELDSLRACRSLLDCFDYVLTEGSFLELYQGQALAPEIIGELHRLGFRLRNIYNLSYHRGQAVQGEFLFQMDPDRTR